MGEDFVLNCSYRANPAVTASVIWYKNGNVLDFQNTPQKNLTSDGSVIKLLKGILASWETKYFKIFEFSNDECKNGTSVVKLEIESHIKNMNIV